jgi:ankyrin repeat protein
MSKRWKNPPKDKKQVRYREEKYGHIRHKKNFSSKNQYNNRFDKSYKKLFDINSKYLRGKTLAHYVVKYNVTGLILYLSKNGLNLDICDDNYDTPLHAAVKANHIVIVKELINAGVDINLAAEFEATPLHLAVSEGHEDIVKLLLKNGADVSLVDERNLSPLDYAIDEKNNQIINLLKNKK